MGNPKQKWTSEEEEALRAGIAKHGAGKWKVIQKDPEFHELLRSRSNIDLKDKWRNMGAAVQGSRDKLRTPKEKPNQDVPPSAPPSPPPPPPRPANGERPPPAPPVQVPEDVPDGKHGPRYDEMIFEALSTAQDPKGLDVGSIVNYIERRIEVPPNFRKQLGSRLRRLVHQGKLEKVDTRYRINNIRDRQPFIQPKPGESLEEAAKTAAYKVAEAENKSYLAAEAVKEAERISKMAEETDSILQLAKDIFERCSGGDIVLVA